MDSNSLDNWFSGKLDSEGTTLGPLFNTSGTRNDPLFNTQLTEGAQLYNNAVGTVLTPEEYDKMINPNTYYTRWTDAGVNNLYSTLFNRNADSSGFDYWTNLAKTNGYDYNQIKSAMMNTPEYQQQQYPQQTYQPQQYTPATAANITGTSSPVPTNTSPLVDRSPLNNFRPQNTGTKFSFGQPMYHTQQSLLGNFNK